MKKNIKTGIIGFGKAAKVFHAPFLHALPELEITKVVERHRRESPETYPYVTVVRDTPSLLEDGSIDLVVITTPNDSHFDLAKKALLAGKHVVVDKPFTITSQQARELVDLAAEKGKIITSFHNRRWDGDFHTVKNLLDQKVLGQLVEFESRFDRFRNKLLPGAWREKAGAGSGVFYDLGPHLIDQALVLFGPPEMITADIRIQREEAETDDNFELILHYPGLKVTLKAGMLVRWQSPRFVLQGTQGSYVKYGMDPQENALKEGRSPDEPGWGVEPESMWGNLDTEMGGIHFSGRIKTGTGDYHGYYRNVAAAISGEAEIAVKPAQILQNMRIIELAIQSSRERKTLHFDG